MNHPHRQRSLAGQHFVNTIFPADHWHQIIDGEALLFHPELDGLYRIWEINTEVRALVGLDQRNQHVKAVARFGVGFGRHESLDSSKGLSIVGVSLDGADIHVVLSNGLHVDLIVLLMGGDEPNVDNPVRVVDPYDEAILVAGDSEDDAPVVQVLASWNCGWTVQNTFSVDTAP